jgi:hypothetical protein
MRMRKPKYTHGFIDRHGKPRFYLRRPGQKKVPLPGLPWSEPFMRAYQAALDADWGKREIGAKRTIAGTVSAALVAYYQSRAFTDLARLTRQNRRAILERFRAEHGHRPMPIPANVMQHIIDKKTPAAQRNFKKAMHGFLKYCRSHGMITNDPLANIELAKMKKTKGHQNCCYRPDMRAPTWFAWDDSTSRTARFRCAGKRPTYNSTFHCYLSCWPS